jgi:hypothetical protein
MGIPKKEKIYISKEMRGFVLGYWMEMLVKSGFSFKVLLLPIFFR